MDGVDGVWPQLTCTAWTPPPTPTALTYWDTMTNPRSLSNTFGAALQTTFTPGDAVVETKDV
jgi:hypothetical protein